VRHHCHGDDLESVQLAAAERIAYRRNAISESRSVIADGSVKPTQAASALA
jgi:hypothetical protein